MKFMLLVSLASVLLALVSSVKVYAADHVTTPDFSVVDDAFLHGYTHNKVTETIDGVEYPTITIQCVDNGVHRSDIANEKRGCSIWTRDIYWGSLGWLQAGGPEVIERIRTSILVLIAAKNKNLADGHVKNWPNNDGRYYIPQAWTSGGQIANDFFPYDSESQADFLLLAHHYWVMTHDNTFIKSIWDDIQYVTKNIELMDTDGNYIPDRLWGSYDYQYIHTDQEEPLMSAKAYAAYRCVADLASSLGNKAEAKRLRTLASKLRTAMNRPIDKGGLWKPLPEGGGNYVNYRSIERGKQMVDDQFIPYENLVPMFFGTMSEQQVQCVFKQLDQNYTKYYGDKWGPMYTAPAGKADNSVLTNSTTPWLAFLDVYLRCKHNWVPNRSNIFNDLMKHAYDIPAAPFTEGAGVTGCLTGGAGRSWDNGNFFHCLISGIYGIEKTDTAIVLSNPTMIDGHKITRLDNLQWKDAVYSIKWTGSGSRIASVVIDNTPIKPTGKNYRLSRKSGSHQVTITLK